MSSSVLAIVGMAMRLPGGLKTDSQFWDFLINKECSSGEIPESRYNFQAFCSNSGKLGTIRGRHGHFLDEDLTKLDAEFFSIPPAELERMDPQQRLLLKVVWECMENAGQIGWQGQDIGCYIGAFGEDWQELTNKDPQNFGKGRLTGSMDFSIANRISYQYNLKGPSYTVRTACSSALVALDIAQRAICSGQCTSAIVGGTNLIISPTTTIAMSEEGALSPTGTCKSFDASADGYARGEAINAIYIKRLADALRDNDPIRAVIRGTATNFDGKTAGMSTPSSDGQIQVIRKAYHFANIDNPLETAYIECHGTGTPLGDPVEAAAVAKIFGKGGIIMGSVKPNVGHAEGASGITSVIKAVLALENEQIPPNIHFSTPNPQIPFHDAELHVPTEVTPWPEKRLKRISVNSFGIGGVNAHAIIESGSYFTSGGKEARGCSKRPYLHVQSADDIGSLREHVTAIQKYIEKKPEAGQDIAYTLGQRREHMRYRAFTVSMDGTQLGASMEQKPRSASPAIAFVFSGQGSQWPGMGKELLELFPTFRGSIQRIDEALQSLNEPPQWKVLDTLMHTKIESQIDQAEFSQPLCTAIQIALVDLLSHWGIRPSAVVGHSSGEIAASYAAGLLSAEEAILVAYYRGQLASSVPHEGAMAAVGMGSQDVQALLLEGVVIACENSPTSVTISGDSDKIELVIKKIQSERPGTFCRRLRVGVAYHSHHMRSIGEKYEAMLKNCINGGPALQYSSVTGASHAVTERMDAAYWRRNLESPVLFSSAIEALLKDQKSDVFVEVGPHSSLAGPLRQIFAAGSFDPEPVYISTMVRGKSQATNLMVAAGRIYNLGGRLNWQGINGTGKVLTDLPPYPWKSESTYWEESRVPRNWRMRSFPHHELLGSHVLETSDIEPAWRNVIRLEDIPWLQDHRVGQDLVFPCAGYVAIIGEAIRRTTGEPGYTIRKLHIRRPLLFEQAESVEIMTSLRSAKLTDKLDSSWYEFTISSLGKNKGWTKHCAGLARGNPDTEAAAPPPESFIRKVDPRRWYRALANLGINYGPSFQGLGDITADPVGTRAAATVREKSIDTDEAFYQVHPTTIDQGLQLLFVAKYGGIARRLEKPAMPESIAQIRVRLTGPALRLGATTSVVDSTERNNVTAVCEGQCVFELVNCTFKSLELGEPAGDMRALQMEWKPLINLAQYERLFLPVPNRANLLLAEKLGILCMLESLQRLSSVETQVSHLRRFHEWMKTELDLLTTRESYVVPEFLQWRSSSSEHRQSLIEDIASRIKTTPFAPQAEAILSVYNNLHGLFTGDIQPLELLTKDNLLTTIYDSIGDRIRLEHFFATYGHSRPVVRILEIGAGTGSMTSRALAALVTDDGTRMYADYTFTDISPAFFAGAKARFKGYKGIKFQTLDISKDPLEQGLNAHSYDLIIAANVLHATPSLHKTLCNIKKLLTPRGHVFLQEICTDMVFMCYVMGILPGWWVGDQDQRTSRPFVSVDRWDLELRKSGFTGVDGVAYDDDEPYQVNSHILSSPAEIHTAHLPVTLLYHSEICSTARNIERGFLRRGYRVQWRMIGQDIPANHSVISLLDLEGPFFDQLTPGNWNSFIDYLSRFGKSGTLWVTRACHVHCTDPRYALVLGVARTIRAELSFDFATFEVDDFTSLAYDALVNVHEHLMTQRLRGDAMIDYEYALVDGSVNVGRYFPLPLVEDRTIPDNNADRKLTIGVKGVLDTLSWMQVNTGELENGQVEVCIRAAGLNFKDVLVAMGVVDGSKDALGLEASGVVTRVGPAVEGLCEGDRVAVVSTGGCFSTRLVVPAHQCVRIPDNLSFENAATMPCVFATVICALIDLARLEPGETVLIHSGCGGVGQAAIQISQMIGAKVYTTVGTEEKAQYLIEQFHIPKSQIYHSRSTSFLERLMADTQGRGVDVVLNSLSGELLHASWACVAQYGRMVEIGKRDILGNGVLSMSEFNENRSFFAVDLARYVRDKSHRMRRCLERCMDLFREGRVNPIHPRHDFQAEHIKDAFRTMQSGRHIGKLVVVMPEDQATLPLTPEITKSRPLFSHESAYLLVGGLGGLGRAVSTWMVESGARNLVYLSRSAAKNKAFFAELEAMGCSVTVVTGSVTNICDIEQAASRSPKPIAGVFQLSMVLQDRGLLQMTFEDWNVTISPKVQGTWNLHHVFERSRLDFFLSFGSVVGQHGLWGQANYAAANTFLDAFTQYRQSLNLPASVIDIGVMDEVGFVSEDPAVFRRLTGMGAPTMTERDLLSAIQFILGPQCAAHFQRAEGQTPVQLTLGLTSAGRGMMEISRNDIRLSVHQNLKSNAQVAQIADEDRLGELLALTQARPEVLLDDSESVLKILTEEIAGMLCSTLSVRKEDLDIRKPIADLGVDSLVSVEIRRWWRRKLGLDISVLEIGNMGSAEQLAALALDSLRRKLLNPN